MDTPHITYGIVEETYTCDSQSRVSYGIVAYGGEDGTATVVCSVRDLSSDKERLLQLAEQCNRLKLSPTHLPDVIEDWLN